MNTPQYDGLNVLQDFVPKLRYDKCYVIPHCLNVIHKSDVEIFHNSIIIQDDVVEEVRDVLQEVAGN
jgi:hypothetical protein